jgi:hypothetical protein
MSTCGECQWIGRTIQTQDGVYGFCRRVCWGGINVDVDCRGVVRNTLGLVTLETPACPAFLAKLEDAPAKRKGRAKA